MSDAPANPPAADATPQGPLVLNLQYTKDLSFEVPGAPGIFTTLREQPRVDLQLDVQARPFEAPPGAAPQGGGMYEVALVIRADAKVQEETCFIAELTYCGVFTVNVDPQSVEPVLLVE